MTNSIENTISGDVFSTEVILITPKHAKQIKSGDWLFDWKGQVNSKERETYKLVIKDNPDIIQGLVSLIDMGDHLYMPLIESAKFNKGRNKLYSGIPGNLVAFACKLSFDRRYDGYVAFDAKTVLIKHYEETLYATHFKGTKMFIETLAAKRLVKQYFKT